jgi:Saxitoxin biosynthesis operon protein SxtJ
MIDINRNPSRRDLVGFGALLPVFVALVGAMAQWRFHSPVAARNIWIVGGVLTLVYWLVPPLRRLIFLGWMYVAYPIGWTVSHVAMAAIYYVIVTPIGLLLRAMGQPPLQRGFDRRARSYWEPHDPSADVSRYFKQF